MCFRPGASAWTCPGLFLIPVRGLMAGSVGAYNIIDAMPDEVPKVVYPHTPGYGWGRKRIRATRGTARTTHSWNNVFRWAKTLMDPRRAALAHHQTRAAQEQTADREGEVLKGVR